MSQPAAWISSRSPRRGSGTVARSLSRCGFRHVGVLLSIAGRQDARVKAALAQIARQRPVACQDIVIGKYKSYARRRIFRSPLQFQFIGSPEVVGVDKRDPGLQNDGEAPIARAGRPPIGLPHHAEVTS